MVAHACHHTRRGSLTGRLQPRQNSISKITRAKDTGGVVQEVERLCSNPSIKEKNLNYLCINLTKYLKDYYAENYETLTKEKNFKQFN
jgi:hypothetical protein